MTLLRTIFKHHHHLFYPKCIFSSPPSLLYFRSLQSSPFSSATTDSPELPQQQPPQTDDTTRTRWSIYGDVFANDTPCKHHRATHITDHEEEEEEEEVEVEESPYPIAKPSGRRGVKTANPFEGGDALPAGIVRTRRSGVKGKKQWVCSNCGYAAGQWWGICPSCELSGTMKEFHEAKSADSDNKVKNGLAVSEDAVGLWLPQRAGELSPIKLEEVNKGFNHQQWRIPLPGPFGTEVSTVLGGGLVPGSLTLVGGDPGVGKSTLLLQVAAMIAKGCNEGKASPVLYVSGEESLQQIGNRAERLGIKSDIYLYSSTDIEDILKKAQLLSPRAMVVDSIQTVYLRGLLGSAGGILQVKECTAALMRFAKTTNIPILLIGHVTKSGEIAGPRVLEHIVDVVLYMEGEKCSSYRMLRAVKNRFGSTDELGVFEMLQSGIQAVPNASEIFLSEQHTDSEVLAGLAVTVLMDASRTFLIEIQALCLSPSPFPVSFSSDQLVNGIQSKRASMIKCVLIKQAGLQLQENAVFLNVVSGWTMTETAGDLAIAAAICSSFLEFPIPKGVAFIGEIGLGGELRMVPRIEKRVYTVAKLGYRTCVVPKQAEKVLETEGLGNMTVVGCKNLKEVINAVFTTK